MTRIQISTIAQAVDAIRTASMPIEIRIPGNVAVRPFMILLNRRRLGVSLSNANYDNIHVIVVHAQKPKQVRYWRQ